MLRILGKISVYGTGAALEHLASTAPIPSGDLRQIGTLRKVPDKDIWCYGSPWYAFRTETLDEEVRNFLAAHKQLGIALATTSHGGIRHALFTLCPVAQTYEDTFACLFEKETLGVLLNLGLSMEIAPEAVMPEAPYWVKQA